MMQTGVRLRQDTETTLSELPKQHRIREKEEELHGLESVHMTESEIKCTAPGLNTLEPECVTANSRVSDLHHTEASLIKTEINLSPTNLEDLKTESLDFTELAFVAHVHLDQVKTEAGEREYMKTENDSLLPDTKSVNTNIKSDEVKLEYNEAVVNDLRKTVFNVTGIDEICQTGLCQPAGEPNAKSKKQTNVIHDVGINVSEKPHLCLQCEKCFFRVSRLNTRRRVIQNTGEKPLECEQCGMSFAQKCYLKSHLSIHTGEKPYKCDQCEKSFAKKSHLKFHQSIHSGEKPFKCDQCEMSFAQKSNLKSHQSMHTGEKPFKCDWCEKSFSKKCSLKCHQSIHTGEKPFKCDWCEKSFTKKCGLKYHQRIHTGEKPFKCNWCEKYFTTKYSLKYHQRIHTDEKPFKCDWCEKSFALKSQLRYHQSIHTGEKNFKCDRCDKSFPQKSYLTSHQIIHKGEKLKNCLHAHNIP